MPACAKLHSPRSQASRPATRGRLCKLGDRRLLLSGAISRNAVELFVNVGESSSSGDEAKYGLSVKIGNAWLVAPFVQ